MINNPERVIDFLRNNRLLSFSTISSETNSPQISLVYYVLGDSNDLFVSASSESDKIKNILKNNRVAMLVGQEVDPIVLQIEGTAEIVTDVALKMKLLLSISNAANQNVNSYNMPHNFIKVQRDPLACSRKPDVAC